MWFMDWIVEELADARDFFLNAFYEIRDWVFPFYLLSDPIWGLYRVFYYLTYYFGYFNEWLDYAAGRIESILSLTTISSYFEPYFTYATDAWNWILNARANVLAIIATWWSTQLQELSGWWNTELQELSGWWSSQLSELVTWWNTELQELREMRTKWDYFWTVLYPKSVNWDEFFNWWNTEIGELQGLIDSSIKELAPLLTSWQEWRGSVTEFFTDPLQWLYDRIDEFAERFW